MPTMHILRRLGAFVPLACLVNWFWIVSVVWNYTSEPPIMIFPLVVIFGVSPSHGIQITSRGLKFPLFYHGCIAYKLMITILILCFHFFSSCTINFSMFFFIVTLNLFFLQYFFIVSFCSAHIWLDISTCCILFS